MKLLHILLIALLGISMSATVTHASAVLGTIDPNGSGNWKAQVENLALGSGTTLNFGKFTTQSSKNITVSDAELRGFAWGEGTGWIVMNCLDTTSGCSSQNSNFGVNNTSTGLLSGFAWGEMTGWINFGPFTNPAISTVKITNGMFGGTLGSAGYAWAQNIGWIKFDCSSNISCVETDWGVAVGTSGGGGSRGSSVAACRDGRDNDGDGRVDFGQDPGCTEANDTSEVDTLSSSPECSDGIDNDGDGRVDYPIDASCIALSDTSEYDTGAISCATTPTDPRCAQYSFCEIFPAYPSCLSVPKGAQKPPSTVRFCTRFPSDPSCIPIVVPTAPVEMLPEPTFEIPFCTQYPLDASCTLTVNESPSAFCETYPSEPTCRESATVVSDVPSSGSDDSGLLGRLVKGVSVILGELSTSLISGIIIATMLLLFVSTIVSISTRNTLVVTNVRPNRIGRNLFGLGFVLSLLALIIYPSIYNALILGAYIIVTMMRVLTELFETKSQ